MSKSRFGLLLGIAALIATYFVFDLGQYLSLAYIKSQQAVLEGYRSEHPLAAGLIYFVAYVAVAGLSLPGAAAITLLGGAIFGLLWGTVLASFASSIGATLAFLASRYVLSDWVRTRFARHLAPIDQGMQKDGAFYLFTLRLVPLVPFFVINLVMGLTKLPTRTFYWVSQLGMLAGTLVYINAGTQLARIESPKDILSAGLLISFIVLGLFPLIAKRILEAFKARRVYARFQRPGRFERNLVVIGAGSAGLVTAYIAAAVKAKVTLIEKHKMGGDCLNTGCVPSKALIRSAKYLSHIARARDFGIQGASADFDFAAAMERVQRVIQAIEPHDSVERYTGLGVECVQGEARITSPWTVEVNGKTLTTRAIVIATGARPLVPPIPGIEQVGYFTSDTIWNLRQLPRRLVVLGGGPIGSELTQCFARFGASVTQVEMGERLLAREDPEFSAQVLASFQRDGVDVRLSHRAKAFQIENGEKLLICEHAGQDVRIAFDAILVALGRVANTAGYGLEELGIPLTKARTIETDATLQTLYPNIYACGDVAGPYQFTHTAAHQAWYASVNALFGGLKKFRADYSVIPWCTFTEPEVARVGLNELEAREKGIAYEVTRYGIDDLDRAIADGEAHGEVKVLTVPGKDRILGVTIAGEHAGDLLAEFVLAMRHNIGLNGILKTIHTYPTLAEANKFAAGVWRKAHAPATALRWLERFHAWRLH